MPSAMVEIRGLSDRRSLALTILSVRSDGPRFHQAFACLQRDLTQGVGPDENDLSVLTDHDAIAIQSPIQPDRDVRLDHGNRCPMCRKKKMMAAQAESSERVFRSAKEALNNSIPFTPFDRLRRAFDKLTTNGINRLPFVLSLSKDLEPIPIGLRNPSTSLS